jgi:uncharacterized membrane protein
MIEPLYLLPSLRLSALFICCSLLFVYLGFPAFQSTIITFILITVSSFLLIKISSHGFILSFFIIAAVVLSLIKVSTFKLSLKERLSLQQRKELFAVLFFIVLFVINHVLTLFWADFFPIGERFRDYALLSSTFRYPSDAVEPWLAGYSLNYYLFWYRFGYFLSCLTGTTIYETYHLLSAFSISLYAAALFLIFLKIMNLPLLYSVFGSLIITYGSNVSGILQAVCFKFSLFKNILFWLLDSWIVKKLEAMGLNFSETLSQFQDPKNWWAPSRVVHGAINEFPAWSFILGDLHPHFLNLASIPLILLLIYEISISKQLVFSKIYFLGFTFFASLLFTFTANAWEVPLLLCIYVSLGSLYLYTYLTKQGTTNFLTSTRKFNLFSLRFAVTEKIKSICASPLNIFKGSIWVTFSIFTLLSLRLSSLNITGAEAVLKFVRAPIENTYISELLLHFGFPIIAITFSLLFFISQNSLKLSYQEKLPETKNSLSTKLLWGFQIIILTIVFCIAFTLQHATPLIIILLTSLLVYSLITLKSTSNSSLLFAATIGIASMLFLLLPEIIFLDDPYGGENERMNTIFKVYAPCWGLLHCFSFYLIYTVIYSSKAGSDSLQKNRNYVSRFATFFAGIFFFFSLMFFINTFEIRKTPALNPLGLSALDKTFPGSKDTILFLRSQPEGVTLEAQGNPYDYTTFVSTMADKLSYLGWANHVNLLTKAYGEIQRRESVTNRFYKDFSTDTTQSETVCHTKIELLLQEKIRYVVFGPLEKKNYPYMNDYSLKCLKLLFRNEEFSIYSPQ